MNEIAIIIPAYNPGKTLVTLVKQLKARGYTTIIVINDGSKYECEKNFLAIKEDSKILVNSTNQGKGESLRRGFQYILEKKLKLEGVITVDSDGQHKIEDIEKVKNRFLENKNSIVLGERDFNKRNTPFKNRLGNKVASKWLQLKTGVELKDTQTGLRAIPIEWLAKLVEIKGKRYEYEMNMLFYCIITKKNILTESIHAIYSKHQKSYFKTIRDVIKILTVTKENSEN